MPALEEALGLANFFRLQQSMSLVVAVSLKVRYRIFEMGEYLFQGDFKTIGETSAILVCLQKPDIQDHCHTRLYGVNSVLNFQARMRLKDFSWPFQTLTSRVRFATFYSETFCREYTFLHKLGWRLGILRKYNVSESVFILTDVYT